MVDNMDKPLTIKEKAALFEANLKAEADKANTMPRRGGPAGRPVSGRLLMNPFEKNIEE